MDFILEMYSKDHPEEFKFQRVPVMQEKDNRQSLQIGWANRLLGKARDKFLRGGLFPLPREYKDPVPPTFPGKG